MLKVVFTGNKINVYKVIFLFGFIIFNLFVNEAVDGFFMVDYTEKENHTTPIDSSVAKNSEFIKSRIGSNIKLQCSLDELVDNINTLNLRYNWYFKHCGKYFGRVLDCYNTNDSKDWNELPCNDVCKSELHLKNVTEKYSGLYQCAVTPKIGNSLDIKLVKTFQLDIQNSSIKIPEFLDASPRNKTVTKGSKAVLHCQIYSEEYPTIKWFRRLSFFKYNNYENIHSAVYYNDLAYELLISSREKSSSRNVYLSKLVIDNVHAQDEGFYACVAISFHGHIIREAYLQINASTKDDLKEYWIDYSEEDVVLPTDPKEFWLLFLMPVGLALLPLSVWSCYTIHKRYRKYSFKHRSLTKCPISDI